MRSTGTCAGLLAITLVALASSGDAAPSLGLVLDPSWPFDLQVTVLALQGLANRYAPAVWLYEPVFWTYNLSTEWFADYYLPTQNLTVSNVGSVCELYTALPAGTVRGSAMYDPEILDATRWLAVTSAGLETLLPLSNATLEALPCLAGLPVVVDYRQPGALGWDTNIAAYNWGMEHLLPRCNPSRVYSAGHTYNDSTGGVWVSCCSGRSRLAPIHLSALPYPPSEARRGPCHRHRAGHCRRRPVLRLQPLT